MSRWDEPPRRLRQARLDNLTLVPGSALPYQARWQQLAHDLPEDAVLIVLPNPATPRRQVLEAVARLLQADGHRVVAIAQDQLRTSAHGPVQLTLLG